MNMMFDGFHHSVAMATSHREGTAAGFTELLVPWPTNMAQLLPALAADVDADRDTGAEPQLTQGLDVQLVGLANIMNASQEAGVSAAPLEPSLAGLKALLAEGLLGPAEGLLRALRPRSSSTTA
ncbi:imine reductase family protein [Streptomyces sp. 2A115]|uniref:imine reductase family protein n=1 Tax=Streptomyces sp. 2A115 TaxID=3457439 RepID=UPI003FD3F219